MKYILLTVILLLTSCKSEKQETKITRVANEVKKIEKIESAAAKKKPGEDSYLAEGYKLVWSDEFNKSGSLDSEKWDYETGFKRNHELQWYQSDNATCQDDRLVIEARQETKPNPTYKWDGDWRQKRKNINYTSACVISKQNWQYGRFEIKAKIKAEDGLWPAIWFLGIEGEWPSNGEVDLMEYYQGNILANLCWGTKQRWNPKWATVKKPVSSFKEPDWDSRFHVWRMDWNEESIELYVDNILLNKVDLNKTVNPTQLGPKNPFRQPHYLLLNLALGGQNGGDVSKTAFPSRYEIEYVRVYQK